MKNEKRGKPHATFIELSPEAQRARRADTAQRGVYEQFPTDEGVPKAGQVESAEQVRKSLEAAPAKRDAQREANTPGPKPIDPDATTQEIKRRSEAPTRPDAQMIPRPEELRKPKTFLQNVQSFFGFGKGK